MNIFAHSATDAGSSQLTGTDWANLDVGFYLTAWMNSRTVRLHCILLTLGLQHHAIHVRFCDP